MILEGSTASLREFDKTISLWLCWSLIIPIAPVVVRAAVPSTSGAVVPCSPSPSTPLHYVVVVTFAETLTLQYGSYYLLYVELHCSYAVMTFVDIRIIKSTPLRHVSY